MIKSSKGSIVNKVLYAKAIFGDEEKQAVMKSLENGWLASGPLVKEFEEKIAELFGKKYGIAVNSGSSANLLAIKALGLDRGSEVITPACTFATTVSEIINNGLVPVFVDSVIGRYTINEDLIESAISNKTSAILVPQLIGGICDMVKLRELADMYSLKLIDDSCFIAGTKILTNNGEKNIEDIVVGDMVLTREGYKKVLVSKETGKKNVITRFGLTGTPNHPIITKNGVVRLDEVKVSDILYTWNKTKLCIEEKPIIDIQNQSLDNGESIIGEAMDLGKQELHYTDKFGKIILAQSQKNITFITKMKILLIIKLKILNLSVNQIMRVCILANQKVLKLLKRTYLLLNKRQKNGTLVRLVENGIKKMERNLGKAESLIQKNVRSVKKNIKRFSKIDQNTVQKSVEEKLVIKESVYNLKVDGNHEYFANGILVHNCDTIAPTLNGKTVASYADVTTTSFYGSHIITACGMGGMIMTDDEQLRNRIVTLRDWGRVGNDGEDFDSRFNFEIDGIPYDSKFLYSEFGYNLKLNESSAAFGLEQVKKLPEFLKIRNDNWSLLQLFFSKYSDWFYLPVVIDDAETNWLAYALTIKKDAPFTRYELLKHFEKDGIQVRVLFSGNITRHPVYKNSNLSWRSSGSFANSDHIMANGFLLGCHHGMGKEEVKIIADSFKSFIDNR